MSKCAFCKVNPAIFECGNACGTFYCSKACALSDWHLQHSQTCSVEKVKNVKPAIMQILLNTPFDQLTTVAKTSKNFALVYGSFVFRKAYALKYRNDWYNIFAAKQAILLLKDTQRGEFDADEFTDFCLWFRVCILENVIDAARLTHDKALFVMASGAGLLSMCQDMLIDKVKPILLDNAALMLAIRGGYLKLVKLLLVHPKVDPLAWNGMSLRIAHAFDRFEIFKLLCSLKGERLVNVSSNILADACGNGEENYVRFMLSLPAERGINNNSVGFGPLSYAAQYGHLNIVNILLADARFDPSIDNMPLRLACGFGHYKIVERLLQDPRILPSVPDNKAIKNAASQGHLDIVKLLLTRIEPNKGAKDALQSAMEEYEKQPNDRLKEVIEYLQFVLRRDEEGDRKKTKLIKNKNVWL